MQAQLDQKTMQAKMAAEIGQELNDKNEDLQHHLNESREFARRLENDATSMREQVRVPDRYCAVGVNATADIADGFHARDAERP